MQGIPGFLNWAGEEIKDGDREGEASFIASLLEFLAVLPNLIKGEHLGLLMEFMDDILLPHLRGSRTAASSGLIRKLAVKAKGRWWMAKLGRGYRNGELFAAISSNSSVTDVRPRGYRDAGRTGRGAR